MSRQLSPSLAEVGAGEGHPSRGTAAGIEVRGLSKSFGAVRAVDDLTFSVEPGAVTGFLGPNGAGKTTTLRMLLGLIRPDRGAATIAGLTYRDIPEPSTVVGAALDASGFHPARTGRAHLQVYCAVNGLAPQRAEEVLELVGLAAAGGRRIGGYSLGMRQRLALAVAMLGDPQVLVLDEPANGLDPEGIVWMRRLLRELAGQGRTVLVSSHVLTEMQQLVDHVVIIDGGQLRFQGPVAGLAGTQGVVVEVRASRSDALRAVLADHEGVSVDHDDSGRLLVSGLDAAAVGRAAFTAGVELQWLAERDGDLERLFFTLTSGAGSRDQTGSNASEVGL
ncbi:ABC transporter ATP-binding protein [Kribbella sp. NBC_01245]|uniref:ABC transporter ATP-binding protein n=1 Tax=Kribbella sp. NBC_01245 TaxID=2903578 RepID=UPI002E2DF3A9|nr:ABC transporter ATP-binding protein [Kribbella sp. NBC_01245]